MPLVNKGHIVYLLFLSSIVFVNGTANKSAIADADPEQEVFRGLGYASVEVFAPVSDTVGSELCSSHSTQFIQGVKNKEQWALRMLDATTKDPDGTRFGSLFQLGNYDECLSVQAVPSAGGAFSGRHCLVSLGPNNLFSIKHARKVSEENFCQIQERMAAIQGDVGAIVSVTGATVAVCIPSSCTSRDLERHLRREMRGTNISVRVEDLACSSREDEVKLRTSDWWAVALLVGLGVTIISSTFFDMVYTNSESRHDLFTAFSLYRNGRNLFKVAPPSPDNISLLNGIRVMNMLWVVFGHNVIVEMFIPSINIATVEREFKGIEVAISRHGTLSIEPFLLLSGLLVCYSFFSAIEKGVKFNTLSYYMHRYIRLTPPYAVMMLLTATLFNYLGDGPLWKSHMAASRESCEKYWLHGLLYVNNYYPQEKMCMGFVSESWYLATDMQLFLLSPLILLPLRRWRRAGKVLLGVSIAAGLFIACAVPYAYQLRVQRYPGLNAAAYIQYFVTHTRFTPWLVGICLGYALHVTKNTVFKPSRAVVVGGWILGLLFLTGPMLATEYFLQKDLEYNRLAVSLYTGLNRPAFALGWALVIFACVKGYGGKFNSFLSCSAMQIVSRLSYTVYLTHMTVMRHFYASVRTPQYYSTSTVIMSYISKLSVCFAAGLLLHLAVEAPTLNLGRMLNKRPKTSRTKTIKEKE